MSKVNVRFLAKVAPYNKGEIAGFEEQEASRLIAKKLAEPVEDAQTKPAKQERSYANKQQTSKTTSTKRSRSKPKTSQPASGTTSAPTGGADGGGGE